MRSSSAIPAEFIGTFALCFVAIAAVLGSTSAAGSGAGLVGVALANGLVLSVAVAAFGGLSGAHFNPAVSLALALVGRLPLKLLAAYIPTQLAGATVATLAARAIYPEAAVVEAQLGLPQPAPWVTSPVLLATEFTITFLLMTAIYGSAIDTRGPALKIGGFGIGLAVTANILACGPVTGASMNPARSFGPALVQGVWDWHGLYWLSTTAGAVASAVIYEHVMLKGKN